MNICLLKCGSVFEHLEHISGDYQDMFLNLFHNNSFNINLDVYKVFEGNYPRNLSKYDAFISSGSLLSVYDNEPWIKSYAQFIRKLYDLKQKHVGICFGHQMMAHALGGKVERAQNGWGLGIKKTIIKNRKPWMNNSSNIDFNLIVSHQDQVTKLPQNSIVLAGNDHCPVGMFMAGDHFLGIQAHPEFNKEYSKETIEYRRELVDSGIIEKALQSLSMATDENLVASWIKNFITDNNT